MESEWVCKSLVELSGHCYSAPKLAKSLETIWELKGNYWDAAELLYKRTCEAEGVEHP